MSEPESESKAVGYCSPPVETRFKKGFSGNPRGRPRKPGPKRVGRDELSDLLYGVNKVPVAGRAVEVRRIDLLLQAQKKMALAGDFRAAEDLLRSWRALENRQRQHHGARRWLHAHPVLVVPSNGPHDTVEWNELYADVKRGDLVQADRAGHRWVRPDWLKCELKRQNDALPRHKARPMESAMARLFKERVSVVKAGIQVKASLSVALYTILFNAAQSSTPAMRSIRKMDDETHSETEAAAAEEQEPVGGVLIVPYAPDSIEEWVRLYGRKASGEYARDLEREQARGQGH